MSTSRERSYCERNCKAARDIPVALTIAGLDPSGGAGVIADLRTFEALGVYGTAIVTTLTYQNTLGVRSRFDLPGPALRGQLEALLDDIRPSGVKIGTVGSGEAVEVISEVLQGYHGPVVLDPVLSSGSGDRLAAEDALGSVIERLIPRSRIVTPNLGELEALSGRVPSDMDGIVSAASSLLEMGSRSVLVTGVKEEIGGKAFASDVFVDESGVEIFRSPWVQMERVHGTGCVLSSAVCALLVRGVEILEAVDEARKLTWRAIQGAVRPGRGAPCAHFERREA